MSTTSIPNLGNIITDPTVRKVIYAIYGLLAFVVAATQVAYAAIPDVSTPVWLTVSLAVTAFVGTFVGGLAVANAPTSAVVVPQAIVTSPPVVADE